MAVKHVNNFRVIKRYCLSPSFTSSDAIVGYMYFVLVLLFPKRCIITRRGFNDKIP